MLNINIWDILWTVINLLLFYFLLKKFLFKPVLGMMERREQMIRDDLDNAKKASDEAEQMKARYEKKIKSAQAEAAKITKVAKQRAARERAEIVEDAKAEAAELIADAQKTIERDREAAMSSAREEIAGLAVMAASRVLEKNIDEESNRGFAEQLLAEVGAGNE
ncbi:MAG: F0F1 ATP synthase subunit B [Ruminococcus sp.]|nr:F0F1 ATP synthase subunit B [Ruminococcus sp.]